MKINQVIREKRKALSLTQEQMAAYLGVSPAAVSKWEKSSSYPDITILPALARLLQMDLNTLLSFREELTEVEIENFVDHLDRLAREERYGEAYREALDKIHQYPTCESLIYKTSFYLEAALFLYQVPEPEQYRTGLEPLFKRLTASADPEVRDRAAGALIAYAQNKGDFAKAEELIRRLPVTAIDREEQLADLYQLQGKYDDARIIWQKRILNSVSAIQRALINLAERSLREGDEEDAVYFADLHEKLSREFGCPAWKQYNAHLQIAAEKRDGDQCLAILKDMLPAMLKPWDPREYRLYQGIKCDEDGAYYAAVATERFCNELLCEDKYAFISEHPDFVPLLIQIGGKLSSSED